MDTTLIALLLLLLLVLGWQASLKIRDTAVRTARNTCNSRNVQFLDGTAALRNTRLGFSPGTGPYLYRTYVFDYSEDGITRHTGCIIMCNFRVESVLMDG